MKSLRFVIAGMLGLLILAAPAVANELTLREALEKAMRGNPELQKYPYQQRMAEADKLQASLRPNPLVGLEIENIAGTGSYKGLANAQTTLSFSQLIELGGKREQRLELAQTQKQQLDAEFRYVQIEILAETAGRFYRLVQLQELAAWTKRQQQRLQDALTVAEQRVESGVAPASEVTRIRLRAQRTAADYRETQGHLAEAGYHLSAMWAAQPKFSEVAGAFSGNLTLPSQADVENAVNQAPQLLRLLESERVLAARNQALKSAASADVTLSAGIRYNNQIDDTGLIFQASMPWQMVNPNQGHISSTSAERDMVLEQQRLVRAQLRTRANTLLAQLQTNQNYLQSIQQDLLPLASQLEQQTDAGYSKGIHSLLEVLDAQDQLAQLEYQQIIRRYALYQNLLELERITGQPFLETAL